MKHNLIKKIIIDSNNKPIRKYLKDPYKNMSIKFILFMIILPLHPIMLQY